MTPSVIEPETFRFVAQHFNHCATAFARRVAKLKILIFGSITPLCTEDGAMQNFSSPVLAPEYKKLCHIETYCFYVILKKNYTPPPFFFFPSVPAKFTVLTSITFLSKVRYTNSVWPTPSSTFKTKSALQKVRHNVYPHRLPLLLVQRTGQASLLDEEYMTGPNLRHAYRPGYDLDQCPPIITPRKNLGFRRTR